MGIVVTLKNRRYRRAGESSAKIVILMAVTIPSQQPELIAEHWKVMKFFFFNFLCPFRCQHGYTGSRCEYLDLDWLRGEKRDIIIFCVIAALILLILLIIFICTYSQ